MNKSAIQSFTVNTKIKLMDLIKQKAFEYGIAENNIIDDDSVINGKVLSDIEKKQRKKLIKKIKEDGYNQVIEEVTYTWFNRFVALRFMEVNGYLPSRTRVFSDENNNFNPQILKEALNVELDKLDRNIVISFLNNNDNEGLYKYLLVCQCNSLNKIIPVLFEKISDYTELLFPDNLLKKDSILNDLVNDISEDDWKEQVQILGWIYQFYVAADRKEFRDAKLVNKDLIPTLTQIFTPDWIVRYMTENSLGRIWLESYPNSPLKNEMKYYVDDAKQEDEVQKQIDEIKYKNVNPEDITVIEPCCGSGHILVYIFDLLYKMYEEQGYKKSDIPTLILEKNIYGLDIDKRAYQLAYFSLLMKARSYDNRLFSRDRMPTPKVFEIIESKLIKQDDYVQIMKDNDFSKESIEIAKYLVETFENGKVIGSLLKVERYNYKLFLNELKEKKDKGANDIFSSQFYSQSIPELMKLAKLAVVLSKKYDAMITNPPYIGISKMEPMVKKYCTSKYPNSKSDMFAMFMEIDFVKKNGFRALVNPDSWMFLVSYEELRKHIINNESIVNMIHLGRGEFDAGVQTTSFVIRNTNIATNGVYFRLVNEKDKELAFLTGGGITTNLLAFKTIPSNIFAYWISEKSIQNFIIGNPLSLISETRNGFTTGNNDLFLRNWFEVEMNNICFDATDFIYALYTGKKWFPYNKGGEHRRWYGNQNYLINWLGDGKEIKKYGHLVPRSLNYMFFESISWSKISSGTISFRYYPKGFMFDVAGLGLFLKDEYKDLKEYCIAFLNSKVAQYYLKFFSPTVNTEVGQIANLPIVINKIHKGTVINLTICNIDLSRKDWDNFETSWDLKKHPLI